MDGNIVSRFDMRFLHSNFGCHGLERMGIDYILSWNSFKLVRSHHYVFIYLIIKKNESLASRYSYLHL